MALPHIPSSPSTLFSPGSLMLALPGHPGPPLLVFKPTTHLCIRTFAHVLPSAWNSHFPDSHSPYPLQASALLMLSAYSPSCPPLNCVWFPVLTCLWGVCLPHLSSRKGEPQALSRCEGQRGSPTQQEEVAAPGSLGQAGQACTPV